jgi:PAS domain S-box-containing protein
MGQMDGRLNALLESTHNGIIAVDRNGFVTIVNANAAKMMNIDRENAIGKHLTTVVASPGLLEVLESGQPQTSVRIRIGERIFITNRTPVLENGQVVGAIGVFQDISELESISQELNSYKLLSQELDTIIESSYDGIYVTDSRGITQRVNTAYQRITDIRAEEVVGHYMGDLVKKGYFDQSVTLLVLKDQRPHTIMQEIKRTGKHVMVTGNPVFNKDGELINVLTNVRDITELNQLRRQLEETRELSARYFSELQELRQQSVKVEGVVAESREMLNVLELARRVAQVDTTVLIQGESGVGKEIVAKMIHLSSRRDQGPFIKINCGAIPEGLLESELFGYESGAFTGAKKEGKAGMIELAAGGTLFLDEIGEMPLSLQVKILRVLQEKEIVHVGGTKTIQVDTRIVAATNKNLQEMVAKKEFRNDLFYRLNVVTIEVPPLRQRRDDIRPLVYHFLQKYNKKYSVNKRIDVDVLEVFYRYEWPGNIRELENTVEQLVVLAKTDLITPSGLPEALRGGIAPLGRQGIADLPLLEAVEQLEAQLIQDALLKHGNLSKAAEKLGIHRTTVLRKARRYSIKLPKEGVSCE